MAPSRDTAAYTERVRALYDQVSQDFEEFCSATLQAGLVPHPELSGVPLPTASNLRLAARAGIVDSEHWLDAGCGVGGPAVDLAGAFPALRIDAITLSPVQAGMARERAATAGVQDRVTVHEGDYHSLPFPDASFDGVWFFESSGYAYDAPRLFSEVFRVLKPGGRLYIKDLFAKPGPYTDEEQTQLDGVDALWAAALVPVREDWCALLSAAGLVDLEHQQLTDATSHFYFGAMFDDDLTLNRFGQAFFKQFPNPDLVHYGEVRGRRPE